jgi:hypothetical protein
VKSIGSDLRARGLLLTLILSCLTRDYVVQVSDRRVVAIDGSWQEDHANKAIFFCGHSCFSYTGIAQLEGLPTDEWLTLKLGTAKALGDGLPLLERTARDAVRAIQFPSSVPPSKRPAIRRLAFVNVAFVLLGAPSADRTRYQLLRADSVSEASAQNLQPLLTVVSNFFRPPDQWLPKAEREFTVFHRRLDENEDFAVFPSGQRIPDEDYKRLVRDVGRSIEQSETGYPAARILARQVQAVSRNNYRVGSNVLCSLIPKTAVLSHLGQYPESGMIPLRPEYATESSLFTYPKNYPPKKVYIYFPGSVKSAAEQSYYGPNYVCSGSMIKGVLMEPTGPAQAPSEQSSGQSSMTPTPPQTGLSANATTTVESIDASSKGLPGGVRPFISINYRLSDPTASAWVFAKYTADIDVHPVDLGGVQITPEPPGFLLGPGFSFFAPIGASTVTIHSIVQYVDGSTQTVTSIVGL